MGTDGHSAPMTKVAQFNRQNCPSAVFQIGAVGVTLHTRFRGVLRQYRSLYREFEVARPVRRGIEVCVDRSPWSIRHRRHFEICVDDEVRYRPANPAAVLPHIEWGISWRLFDAMPTCLQIHASSLEFNGKGAIFAGHAGSGKSTLAIGLLTQGWRYLCDEFALVDTHTLTLRPYPRAICAKEPSFPILQTLGVSLHRDQHFSKGTKGKVGFVKPNEVRPGAIGGDCPIHHVFFPRYVPGAIPQAIPLSRAEAALALHEYCFNLLNCNVHPAEVLSRVVRGASCYRLIVGDLRQTCEFLAGLVDRKQLAWARTA